MNEMASFHCFFRLAFNIDTIHCFTLYKTLLKLGCLDKSLLISPLCSVFAFLSFSWALVLHLKATFPRLSPQLSSCLSPGRPQPHSLFHHVSNKNSQLHLLVVFIHSFQASHIQNSKSALLKCVFFLLPEKMKQSPTSYPSQKCDYNSRFFVLSHHPSNQ